MRFADIIGNAREKKALLNQAKENRISHAQLFLGPEGSAKLPLAVAYSGYLLCENPEPNDACGQCSSCQKISSLTHPDLHFSFPVVLSATEKIASSDDRRSEWNKIAFKKSVF